MEPTLFGTIYCEWQVKFMNGVSVTNKMNEWAAMKQCKQFSIAIISFISLYEIYKTFQKQSVPTILI